MADEDTTEADVKAAEDAQREAEALALALEERIVTGDDSVTAEQLAAQKSAARYAVLRVQGVRAKLAAAREAKRQRALGALRSEIDGYVADSGARLAADLQGFFDARERFLATAAEHDATVTRWTQRAQALNVAQVNGSLRTSPDDAHIGLGRGSIESLIVGKRRLTLIRAEGADGWLMQFIRNAVPIGSYPVEVYLNQLRAIDGDEEDA